MEMAKNFRKCLSCYHIKSLLISLWYMSGVKKVLQRMGALWQVVCDMGFSTCTVSIVTYMLYGFLFPKKSLFVLRLEKIYVAFFSDFIAQYTAYVIQYPPYSKKV